MNKKVSIWMALLIGMVLLLSACGEKSHEDVVKKLDGKLEELEGYKVEADMVMKTGQEDQTYGIDVWHKKDDMYRVALSNTEDEKGNQIILKNEDGVFVLTPALDKSFKFQTDWPHNSSQPYLFQSLVKDIKEDEEAEFETTDNHYVFKTTTNYQSNNNLPYQEIYIDKKEFTPTQVKVMDKDKQALVEVNFSEFNINPSFEEKDFVLEENMETNSEVAETSATPEEDEEMSVVFPENTAGAELTEKKEVQLEDGKRVILTYAGEKNFTLVGEKRTSAEALSSPQEVQGDIVNLGHAVGALSNNAIEWHFEGTDYYLASEELTKDELVDVAQSVIGKEVK
ncbi:outer membrane lipoprotein carrier protein LolA [Virgibacillus sp. MSJ-26]|uniref:LolA family protein n=1 Tax=Virgibacillus sp. MSJ-26 TaxID=2841522 RepID=UPI001C125EA9|nr:outer membrane lipoprotein carrier protein LolA [Virgibacillus sp. MSJ-26]MBU5468555.1 outer membrane lipoprotein carrier protein LolA [Virgibacillus sp. MSJ-26]